MMTWCLAPGFTPLKERERAGNATAREIALVRVKMGRSPSEWRHAPTTTSFNDNIPESTLTITSESRHQTAKASCASTKMGSISVSNSDAIFCQLVLFPLNNIFIQFKNVKCYFPTFVCRPPLEANCFSRREKLLWRRLSSWNTQFLSKLHSTGNKIMNLLNL
jgi:hypothetical protein